MVLQFCPGEGDSHVNASPIAPTLVNKSFQNAREETYIGWLATPNLAMFHVEHGVFLSIIQM